MIAIIVAHTKNGRVIGNNGKIPWNIPGELDRFKFLTTGNAVIMGRKTFEEIGKPLPNRFNIIVSSTKSFTSDNCITVPSVETAIKEATKRGYDKIFIAGGTQIYKKTIDIADILYITEIEKEFSGTATFPKINESLYQKEINAHFDTEIPYTYVTYTKIK